MKESKDRNAPAQNIDRTLNDQPPGSPPIRNLSLRAKLTSFNLGSAFLIILVLGIYIYVSIRQSGEKLVSRLEENIRQHAEDDLRKSSREQAAVLDGFFDSTSRDTSIIGGSIRDTLENSNSLREGMYWDSNTSLIRLESGSWDNSNEEIASIFIPAGTVLTEALKLKLNLLKYSELVVPTILKDNPDIIGIYFGGASRETIYFPNIDLANIVPADFDVTGRQWYVAANPENNPELGVVWSAPYEDAALNGLVITASVPVIDKNNRFQGVAAMDVQLRRITEQIASIKAGDTGYAFLLDSENRIISLPDQGFDDFQITDEASQLSGIIDVNSLPNVSSELTNLLNTIAMSNQGLLNVSINGSERYAAYYFIPQAKYKLVILVPTLELLSSTLQVQSQIDEETQSILNTIIFIIAFIFLIAGIVSFYFGNIMTSPLRSLNEVAAEIIRGNYDQKTNITSGDEIETLGETFNAMTGTVKGLISSLEVKVSERTSELEHAMQQSAYRQKQYEAIARVAQVIGSQKKLKELLPQITEVISEQFGFYHVGIFLNDAADQYAVLVAANSAGGKRMLDRGHQLKIGTQGIVGYVTGTKQPRIALSVGDDSVYFDNPDLRDTQSEMALPLLQEGAILGALDVQSAQANAFTNEDYDALSILSELVSIAIQNARLYDKMERSLAEAEAASRQYFRENWDRLAADYKIAGYRYNASGAEPVAEFEKVDQNLKDRKQFNVPVKLREEVIGEISVTVPKTDSINNDQMDLVRAIAERVAVIAENARLFDETKRRADRERLVSEITTKIRGTNDPREMLETAVKELRSALNVSRVEILPQKKISPDK